MSAEAPPSDDDQRGAEELGELISYGADVSGNLAGAGAGFLIAGPPGAGLGALAGPAVSRAFRHLAREFKQRFLGEREEQRISVLLAFADQRFREREEAGDRVRNDGFFDDSVDERSAGSQVIEAVILAAQREVEEKKLPYYAALLANLAFDTTFDRPQASLLVRLGQSLSYRQLCLLELFASSGQRQLRADNYGDRVRGPALIAVLQEAHDLYARGLINNGGTAVLSPANLKPSSVQVQGLGHALLGLMDLRRVPESDLAPLEMLLR